MSIASELQNLRDVVFTKIDAYRSNIRNPFQMLSIGTYRNYTGTITVISDRTTGVIPMRSFHESDTLVLNVPDYVRTAEIVNFPVRPYTDYRYAHPENFTLRCSHVIGITAATGVYYNAPETPLYLALPYKMDRVSGDGIISLYADVYAFKLGLIIPPNSYITKYSVWIWNSDHLSSMHTANVILDNDFYGNLYLNKLNLDPTFLEVNAEKLRDLSSSTTKYTITVGETNLAKFSEEQITIVEEKGWNIV